MTQNEWILLPAAVAAVREHQSIDEAAARAWLLAHLQKEWVRARAAIAMETRERRRDYLLLFWEGDLANLEGAWWQTGNVEWEENWYYRGIQIHAGDLEFNLGQKKPSPAPIPTTMTPELGAKRGPRFTHDWEGALAHLVALANRPDGLHPELSNDQLSASYLANLMGDWFSAQHADGASPSDRLLRERGAKVLAAIRACDP